MTSESGRASAWPRAAPVLTGDLGQRADPAWAGAGSARGQADLDNRTPCPVNPVILALVEALRDVERRRTRGNVLTHLPTKRTDP